MKRLGPVVVLLLALILLLRSSTAADADLTAAVNAAWLPRTETAALHDLAHRRAAEATINFSHDGMQTAEVLAWNQGTADPLGTVVQQWIGSAPHNSLLSNPTFDLIGCGAVITSDNRYVAACVLATSAAPAPTVPAPPPRTEPAPPPTSPESQPVVKPAPVVALPNTAMRSPCLTSRTLCPSLNRMMATCSAWSTLTADSKSSPASHLNRLPLYPRAV